jgi:RNA polymerase sigma-70 factor (ECF subfamily)
MERTQREQRMDRMVEAHAVPLRRYLLRRGAGNEAEDLAVEALLVAWRRLDDVPPEAELPWLYRTAWHLLANHRRRMRPVPDPDADRVVGDFADDLIEDLALRDAWRGLSERDREVLRLVAWEGLDGPALAEALGIGRGGAGAALSRARARLAAGWAAGGAERPAAPGTQTGMETHPLEGDDGRA